MKKINLNEKQKKIIEWIMVIWFAVFGSIGMVKTAQDVITLIQKKSQAEVKQVYADGTSESFTIVITQLTLNSTNQETLTLKQDIIINIAKNGITISSSKTDTPFLVTFEQDFTYWLNDTEFWNSGETPPLIDKGVTQTLVCYFRNNIREIAYGSYGSNIIPNSAKIEWVEDSIEPLPNSMTGAKITATDGEKDIEIYLWTNDNSWQISPFLTTNLNTGAEYLTGYRTGYDKANSDKESYGLTEFNKGYRKGIEEANEYSFTGLISAVFDVPIQTIFGMLNFEILGVNILTLVTSILSIALLIFVLRMIFG